MSWRDACKLIYYEVTRKLERIHFMKIEYSNKSNMDSLERKKIRSVCQDVILLCGHMGGQHQLT